MVALAGAAALSAGWIDGGGTDEAAAGGQPALTRLVSTKGGNAIGEIYKQSNDGVVFVQAEQRQSQGNPFDPFGGGGGGTATGSGFVIDTEGHILTNAHVVDGAGKVEVKIGGSDDLVDADVVGTDPSTDVALLDVDADAGSLHPLPLGKAGSLAVGDPVVAIGNPFGLDRTVTSGIVSALQREIQAPNGFSISDVIQTDAAINPGNSGGPLLDDEGRVIGINSQIASQGGGSEGVGFAVPIDTAGKVVDELLADGKVDHAYLGIQGADLSADIAQALHLSVDHGAMVSEALKGGPADQAGVRGAQGEATIGGQAFPLGGDIIVAIDGEAVSGMDDVISAVESHQAGDTVTLTIVRGKDRRDVDVELGTRPDQIQDTVAPTQP